MPAADLPDTPNLALHRGGAALTARVKHNKVSDFEVQQLRGELRQIAEAAGKRLAVDLSGVEMLTSAGIGLLIETHQQCEAAGGRLVVFGVQEDVLGVLKLTRLDRILNIRKDEQAAMHAF